MNRRRFLGSVAGTTALAGCTGGGGGDDSDDDGVADSEDYAPKDPNVQAKSDLSKATTTATTGTPTEQTTEATTTTETTTTTAETTTTTADTTTTTETTTTASADANTIEVQNGMADGESGIVAYSSESVSVRVEPDGPTVDGLFDGERAKLYVAATPFPSGSIVAEGYSDPASMDGTRTLAADVDLAGTNAPTGERLYYLAFLVPEGETFDTASEDRVAYLHESDPFELHRDSVTIERSPHPASLPDDSGDGYERDAIEGAYSLSFEGSTQGQSWSVNFYIYKSSYVEAVKQPRGRSRSEYVAYAQQNGFADELAGILSGEAEYNGFSGKRKQVEFVIDFVQNLPYVPDDVSKGFDDYTKFITETITEAGGDCEDTSIMLAAILQAEPFGYDTVLIQPPGHMAVGIYGSDDLPGYYWTYEDRKYYYIETTGTGWGIGDLPDTYKDAEAYIYQV